jgi:stress-induced morphogen
MPIDKIALEKVIKRAFPVTHLEINDESSGCGESYSIVLVSEVRYERLLFLQINV